MSRAAHKRPQTGPKQKDMQMVEPTFETYIIAGVFAVYAAAFLIKLKTSS